MDPANNPSFLDKQHPNLIDTKKFGDIALFPPMAHAGTRKEYDVALRCRALVEIYTEGNSSRFAADIGVSATRWNNIERTGKLSTDVMHKIVDAHPEMSTDWLWYGKDNGLTTTKSEQYLAAYNKVAAKMKKPLESEKAKRPRKSA